MKAADRMPAKIGRYKVRRAYYHPGNPDEWAEFTGTMFTNYDGYKVIEWLDESPTAAGDGKEDAEAVEFTEWATGNYNKIFDEYKNEWLWWNDGIRGYSTSELYTIFKNRNNQP